MRRLWILVALAACGGDDEQFLGTIDATITHYDYRFDIDTRAAHARVTATANTAGNCLTLPFRAHDFDPATALVDDATPLSATTDAATITLCSPNGTRAGSELTLDVDLVIPLEVIGPSQVGYSRTVDGSGNAFYYLVSWVGGCDKFGPCDARPDQFATYRFTVTHPDTMMVACPGAITQLSGTQTECAFDHAGGPTYSTFGVAAYPTTAWIPTDKGMWGSVHATVYDRPQTLVAAAIDPVYNAGFVTWMEQQFGAFPYGTELRILTAPTYWNGFEHPGNIILDDSLARTTRPTYLHNVQHILGHEIVHQWAGDQTTLADTYDFVWKESMAEYLTFAYEDMVEPVAAAATAFAWKTSSTGAAFFPVPGERPALFDYYGDVYGPGPMILFRQIEVLSSRAQVLAAIKTLLGAQRAISIDDVIAALETSTGLDLDTYTAAWIKGTGAPVWPTVRTTYQPGGATDGLRVEIVAGQERRCKFHIALRGANPTDVLELEVNTFTGGIDQMRSFPSILFQITRTEIDSRRECLAYPMPIAMPRTTTKRVHPWRSDRGRAILGD